MAVIATLVGGICGFFTFVFALMFSDVSFWAALGLYVLVGLSITTTLILAAMAVQALGKLTAPRPAMVPCPSRVQAGNPMAENRR